MSKTLGNHINSKHKINELLDMTVNYKPLLSIKLQKFCPLLPSSFVNESQRLKRVAYVLVYDEDNVVVWVTTVTNQGLKQCMLLSIQNKHI